MNGESTKHTKMNEKDAHRFSSRHRAELEQDRVCGCFFCIKVFDPKEIYEWIDDNQTAICPYCGVDSVIGESSGFPITELFLKRLNDDWF
ncbi:cytoplasmic protein [Shouchella miscanthi]